MYVSIGLCGNMDYILQMSFIRYRTGWTWEEVEFSPRVARRVRLTVLSSYDPSRVGSFSNGLVELEYLVNNSTGCYIYIYHTTHFIMT